MPVSSTSMRDDELAHLLVDRRSTCESSDDRHQERGQQHQPERDAVDAELEVDAERLHPDLVDLELEAGLGGSKCGKMSSETRKVASATTSPMPL